MKKEIKEDVGRYRCGEYCSEKIRGMEVTQNEEIDK